MYRAAQQAIGGMIAAIIISFIVTIALYILFLPDSKRPTLNKTLQSVHDFLKLRSFMIESIFRFVYVWSIVGIIIGGFFTLFKSFWGGLFMMILGPIIVRICYEMILIPILLVKNVIEINARLRDMQYGTTPGAKTSAPAAPAAPVAAPVAPAAPAAPVAPAAPKVDTVKCPGCGAEIKAGSKFCGLCGYSMPQ